MATDFIQFNEGKDAIMNSGGGVKTVITFALSTKSVGTSANNHASTDTFAGGFGAITGTGYAAITATRPSNTDGIISFAKVTFNSGTATNWSNAVKSWVMYDSNNKLLHAGNLNAGSGSPVTVAAYDMSPANSNLDITPTYFIQNVGGG